MEGQAEQAEVHLLRRFSNFPRSGMCQTASQFITLHIINREEDQHCNACKQNPQQVRGIPEPGQTEESLQLLPARLITKLTSRKYISADEQKGIS